MEKLIVTIFTIIITMMWAIHINNNYTAKQSIEYFELINKNNKELFNVQINCDYNEYSFCRELSDELEKNAEFYVFNDFNSSWNFWIKTIENNSAVKKLNLWPWIYMCWDSLRRYQISNQFTFIDLVKKYNSDPKLKEENKDIIEWLTRLSKRIDTDLKDYFDNFCTRKVIDKINKFYWDDLDIKVRWYEDHHQLENIELLRKKQKDFDSNSTYFKNL